MGGLGYVSHEAKVRWKEENGDEEEGDRIFTNQIILSSPK